MQIQVIKLFKKKGKELIIKIWSGDPDVERDMCLERNIQVLSCIGKI